MNTTTEKTSDSDHEMIEQFLRDSGVWLDIQQTSLKVSLRQVANAHGFEIVKFSCRNRSVLFTAYVGDENSQRVSLRCRSMVRRLMRAAGVEVSPDKLHVRHRRAVVRVACTPQWD